MRLMTTQPTPDAQLMALVAQGDQAAFSALVKRHLPRAYAIARRTLSSDSEAEDAAQEAFSKIWVNARDYKPEKAAFTTWLHRIVVNASLDMARKKRPMAVEDEVLHAVADTRDNAEQQLSDDEQAQQVQAAIAALPAQQRAAITLCYTEEYSNAEAASMLGIHIKALEGLLVRARKSLRSKLGEMKKGARDAA